MMKLTQKLPNSVIKSKSKKDLEDFDIFGKDLKMLEALEFGKEIPEFIWMMGYFIRTYGILIQGIFRISGNRTRMDEIKSSYIKKRTVNVSMDDVHNVTGLFKLFIREIPNGIIPYNQSTDLIDAMKIYKTNENLDLLKSELLKMPVPNYNLLKYSCQLLHFISKYSSSNLMNSENLGTVFGPTLFIAVEDMSLLSLQNSLTTLLIQKYDDLFKVSAPVHVNLNESSDCSNKFDSLPSISTQNGNVSNGSDNNLILKFGESTMLMKISQEDQLLSVTYPEEDNLQLSDSVDLTCYSTTGSSSTNNNNIYHSGNFNGNSSVAGSALTRSQIQQNNNHSHNHYQQQPYTHNNHHQPQVSGPMSSAINMCISNHLGLFHGLQSSPLQPHHNPQSQPPHPQLSYDSDMGSLPLSTSSSLNYDNSLPSSSSYQHNNYPMQQQAFLQYQQQFPPFYPHLISDLMLNPELLYYQSLQHRFLQQQQYPQYNNTQTHSQQPSAKKRSGSIQHDNFYLQPQQIQQPAFSQNHLNNNPSHSRRSASVMGTNNDFPVADNYQLQHHQLYNPHNYPLKNQFDAPNVPPRSASEMKHMINRNNNSNKMTNINDNNNNNNIVPQLDFSIFRKDETDDRNKAADDFDDENGQQYDMVPLPNDNNNNYNNNINKQKFEQFKYAKSNNRHNSIDVAQLDMPKSYFDQESLPASLQLDSSQLNKKISALKKQLRSFDEEFYERNGVRPDKAVKTQDNWYKSTQAELKQLRQLKEKLLSNKSASQQQYSNDNSAQIPEETENQLLQHQQSVNHHEASRSNIPAEAPPVVQKRKSQQQQQQQYPLNASGDNCDDFNQPIKAPAPVNTNPNSRPVSALSDILGYNNPPNKTSGASGTGNLKGQSSNFNEATSMGTGGVSMPNTPVTAVGSMASGTSTPHNTKGAGATANYTEDNMSDRDLTHLKLTLDAISDHLNSERRRDGRPDNLDDMTPAQIETEKISMQKALLNFENKYGRKKNSRAVQMMKPLYDRYRQVKKKLSQLKQDVSNQPTRDAPNTSAWTKDRPDRNEEDRRQVIKFPSDARWTTNIHSPIDQGEEEEGEDDEEGEEKSVPPAILPRKSSSGTNRNIRRLQSTETNARAIPSSTNYRSMRNNQNTKDLNDINELSNELQKLLLEKKELQIVLKEFENSIEKEKNRKIERSDRVPKEREYTRYREIKNRIRELEDSVSGSRPINSNMSASTFH